MPKQDGQKKGGGLRKIGNRLDHCKRWLAQHDQAYQREKIANAKKNGGDGHKAHHHREPLERRGAPKGKAEFLSHQTRAGAAARGELEAWLFEQAFTIGARVFYETVCHLRKLPSTKRATGHVLGNHLTEPYPPKTREDRGYQPKDKTRRINPKAPLPEEDDDRSYLLDTPAATAVAAEVQAAVVQELELPAKFLINGAERVVSERSIADILLRAGFSATSL